MKKYIYILMSLSLFINPVIAQNNAIHIGIIPFSAIDYNAGPLTHLMEDQVSACFVNKGRFYLLDRGVTEKLKRELEAAKENTSLYAKIVADQGHLAGAQYLITGKVGSMDVSQSTSKNYLTSKTTTVYHGTVHVSMQINSVETGQVVFTEPFTIVSNDYENSSRSDMLDNILCKFKSAVRIKVRGMFSSAISILQVEKEKNGLPQEVLINAGRDVFENGKNSNCEPTSSITSLFTKKIFLDVIAVEDLNLGGSVSKREKKIGELKVESVEGDVSVCKVTKGDKELKEFLDKKKPLLIRLQ